MQLANSLSRTHLLLVCCSWLVVCHMRTVSAAGSGDMSDNVTPDINMDVNNKCSCEGWIVAFGITTGIFCTSTAFLIAVVVCMFFHRRRVQTATKPGDLEVDSKYWKDHPTAEDLRSPQSTEPGVFWYPLDTTQTFTTANGTAQDNTGSSGITMEISQRSSPKIKPQVAPKPPTKSARKAQQRVQKSGRQKPVRKAPDPPAHAKKKKWWNRTYVNTHNFLQKHREPTEYAIPIRQQQASVKSTRSEYKEIDVTKLDQTNPYDVPH